MEIVLVVLPTLKRYSILMRQKGNKFQIFAASCSHVVLLYFPLWLASLVLLLILVISQRTPTEKKPQ
jgi:hypothetical protein